MYYARVVFDTNASAAERHDDVEGARRWIEREQRASPESFRFGQILAGRGNPEVVAMCDVEGWHAVSQY
jgi:hypothetical protein